MLVEPAKLIAFVEDVINGCTREDIINGCTREDVTNGCTREDVTKDARGTGCHAEWIHACTYFRNQNVLLLCLPRRMNSSVETTFIVSSGAV